MQITPLVLARILADQFPGEKIDIIHRRIRHWSQLGAIPVSDGIIHKGSGRARLFDETGARLAAIGMCLASWQIPIGILKTILCGLHEGIVAGHLTARLWRDAINGAQVYLVHEPILGTRLLPNDDIRKCIPMDGSVLIVPIYSILRGINIREAA